MIQSKATLSLPQIVQALHTLCQEGRTGVFRITTDNNHTAQFGLDAGRIVSARYRIKRGAEALELIGRVRAGQFGFEEGKSTDAQPDLPGNDAIFAQLGYAVSAPVPQTPVPVTSTPSPSSTPPTAPTSGAKVEFSTAARIALEDALTEHIGPMAGIVCRNVLAQASDIGEAITMMKAKIPDPARAEQFERNVMSRTLV